MGILYTFVIPGCASHEYRLSAHAAHVTTNPNNVKATNPDPFEERSQKDII